MKKFLEFIGALLVLATAVLVARAVAQPLPESSKPAASATPTAADIAHLVEQQFGDRFKIVSSIGPLFGDFDGDGRQDLIVVATGDNPLLGEAAHNYKTLDPYNASFGYGNPKVTLAFGTSEGPQRFLLVLHSWKQPSRKFVLVNIPFEQLRLGSMMLKKKPVDAIESIDSSGVQGAIFWDGRKYRWEIVGTQLESH